MTEKPVIGALGMISALGLNAAQTCSSVRAGIERFSESSIYNRNFRPFTLGLLPSEALPPLVPELEDANLSARQIRMLRLAAPALAETLAGVPNPEQIPVILGAPDALTDRPNPLGDAFLSQLALQADIVFDLDRGKITPGGRAGCPLALQEAVKFVQAGDCPLVVVGGVDTFLDLYLLGTLDAERRILGDDVMDGFRPGEGACFLLIGTPDAVKKLGKKPLAVIDSIGFGVEKGHRYSDEPYKGDGLADAFRACFQNFGDSGKKIAAVFAGFNGESFHAKEWGVAYLRNAQFFEDEPVMRHPADCLGDTGASLGALMLGLAAADIRDGQIAGPTLVWSSSDQEQRAAMILDVYSAKGA